MGISRFGSRLSILCFALLIAGMMAASAAVAQTAPLGDVYSSQGAGAGGSANGRSTQGVIISITPIGIHRVDVKVQNPANGNIHSVTLEDDVVKANGLQPGQRVTEYNDFDTGLPTLAPTLLQQPGQTVPGETQKTGTGETPVDTGNNGGTPPANPVAGGDGGPTYPAAPPNNGGFPTNPIPGVAPPPRTGGVTGGGGPTYPPPSVPYYPAPKMVGNYVGSGSVNGTPVDIGGPNAVPIPAGARPGTPVTVSSKTGDGPWKQFRGTLRSNANGYYVEFNQGLYQGYDSNGQFVNRWVPIQAQNITVHAG